MIDAGRYSVLLRWLKAPQSPTGGQQKDDYGGVIQTAGTDQGALWCWLVESQGSSGNGTITSYRAEIHVRGIAAIAVADKLLEVRRGYTWQISGAKEDWDNNELVIEAYR